MSPSDEMHSYRTEAEAFFSPLNIFIEINTKTRVVNRFDLFYFICCSFFAFSLMSKIWHKVRQANIYLTQHSRAISYCHKLGILNSFIHSTICHRTLLFQTMNSARSNTLSLIYQCFKSSGAKI